MSEGLTRHKELNGGAPPNWRSILPNPKQVEQDQEASPPKLYAIVSSWYDADIIEANIKNCFAQGASRVFLLDNTSPDNTIELAQKAGAILAKEYKTEVYDEDLRIHLQNELILSETTLRQESDLWWMVLDSDEFPTGKDGRTIIETIRGLPPEIRMVGCDSVDLYPTKDQHYTAGHPALCMTHGVWRRGGMIEGTNCGHWKHPLIRLLNGQRDIAHNRGNHTVTVPNDSPLKQTGSPILQERLTKHSIFEPHFDITLFHAPIRSREAAQRRLEALCSTQRNKWDDQVTKNQGAIKRWESLNAIFEERWEDVELPHTQMYGRSIRGLALYPWQVLLPNLKREYLCEAL